MFSELSQEQLLPRLQVLVYSLDPEQYWIMKQKLVTISLLMLTIPQ